ncbi:ABC transporter ATP-binding protein [Microaceticoccus formicicus]|uniref:ABC transporter ATP-binding protein n=1 Tax=Microaceticoccus formicicus TaxID=3118105 RepID=UPI003CD04D6D|nr:ABC transporter ATP-binding protein [Peptoniphilaceae bacterium AMB_02]
MSKAISFNSVTKQYSEFTLDKVSFDIPKGFITGFIGPNGSGKTTSIKSLLSLINPDSGLIKVFNKDIKYSKDYLQEIGIVMDESFLVKDWLVKDISKSFSMFYTSWDDMTFTKYLKQFLIPKNIKIKELSRGMAVKLMLAIALSHDTKILVLDEPTSGLDPSAREEICEILQEYVEDDNRTVFFSTHITADLESIADYIVFLIDGNIVYSGTKDGLIERYVLIKGGLKDLEFLDNTKLIGMKKGSTFFEAIIDKNLIRKNDKLVIEPASLEKLIIFFNRGAKHEKNK